MGKIFIVDAEWKADSKVFIVDAEWKSNSNEFVVDAEWKSNEKVFIVDAEWKADRKIFLVDAEWKAKKGSGAGSSSRTTFSTSSKRTSVSDRSSTTNNDFSSRNSSESNFSTGSTSSGSSSGCGGTLLKWFITIIIIGAALNYFGITDNLLSDSSDPIEFRVVADSLNMRSEPNTNSEVITIIPRDSIVRQLNDSVHELGNDKWIYVTNSIDSGWVNNAYLEEK
jgi:hypothetical protein